MPPKVRRKLAVFCMMSDSRPKRACADSGVGAVFRFFGWWLLTGVLVSVPLSILLGSFFMSQDLRADAATHLGMRVGPALAFLIGFHVAVWAVRDRAARLIVCLRPCPTCGAVLPARSPFCPSCDSQALPSWRFLGPWGWIENVGRALVIWWFLSAVLPGLVGALLPALPVGQPPWPLVFLFLTFSLAVTNSALHIRRDVANERKRFVESQVNAGDRCTCGYDLRGSETGRCPECGRDSRPPRPPKKICECGYDLRGNVSGVCPECGREIGVRVSD